MNLAAYQQSQLYNVVLPTQIAYDPERNTPPEGVAHSSVPLVPNTNSSRAGHQSPRPARMNGNSNGHEHMSSRHRAEVRMPLLVGTVPGLNKFNSCLMVITGRRLRIHTLKLMVAPHEPAC